MPHAPSTGPALSPAAKRLQHILQSKLPVAHAPDAIQDLLKVIKACSKEELAALELQPPAQPSLCPASCAADQPLPARLQAIQSFISSFQYNQCTSSNYNVSKKRPLQAILATAAGIIVHSLPIKCIEAVFLGILLTQGWANLQRLPLGFKSRGSDGQVYRHIVLVVHDTCSGLYGALGISRCSQLMDKPLQYSSLAALVQDYHDAYRHVKHELLKVRVGLPVEHAPAWSGPVCWRFCTVNMQRRPWMEAAAVLNKHAAGAADLQRQFREATAAAAASHGNNSSSSGTRSVPHSPRGSPAGASPVHRPQSALRVRCSTPVDSDGEQQQHLPALQSPSKQQQQQPSGMWRSPAPSCCSSPRSGAQVKVYVGALSPRHPQSPRFQKVQATAGQRTACGGQSPLSSSPGQQGSGRSSPKPQLTAELIGDNHSREVDMSDDDANDSDSEVNVVVRQMLQHRVG